LKELELSYNKLTSLPVGTFIPINHVYDHCAELTQLSKLEVLGLDQNPVLEGGDNTALYERSTAVGFLNHYFGTRYIDQCHTHFGVSLQEPIGIVPSLPITITSGGANSKNPLLRDKIYGIIFGTLPDSKND
jgi:Leucine-rich repeat (LRR) protein